MNNGSGDINVIDCIKSKLNLYTLFVVIFLNLIYYLIRKLMIHLKLSDFGESKSKFRIQI